MNYSFSGGLILEKKGGLTQEKIVSAGIPPFLIVPLLQHIGTATMPIVNVGDRVLKGQMIAECGSEKCSVPMSAPIHAPSSGTVVAIEKRSVPHPSGLQDICIVIETDGKDEWISPEIIDDCTHLSPDVLRQKIAQAGIVGLGGAGFPSHLKLQPNDIHTLILNGAECEPLISCDDYLMRERPLEVIIGARILAYALGGVKRCIIAIEDNKPQSYQALKEIAKENFEQLEIIQIPTRYPAGGEQQLIKVILNQELPKKMLPRQLGIVVHNVGTAAAVFRAVKLGQPLISRIVTVTGDAVETRQNLDVLLGTPINYLLKKSNLNKDLKQLTLGGPMMGFNVPSADLPIIKTTNCLIALSQPLEKPQNMPCIRCGSCEQVCPANLLPQQLYWYARAKDFEKIQDYHLFECIECGCCAYVCPSELPLVQFYRYAKSEIRAQTQEKLKAQQAKQRFEFRQFRQEKEKAERAARHQQAGDKKAFLAAAIARRQQAAAQKNVENTPTEE
jgi:electron transport complex protein RnfC